LTLISDKKTGNIRYGIAFTKQNAIASYGAGKTAVLVLHGVSAEIAGPRPSSSLARRIAANPPRSHGRRAEEVTEADFHRRQGRQRSEPSGCDIAMVFQELRAFLPAHECSLTITYLRPEDCQGALKRSACRQDAKILRTAVELDRSRALLSAASQRVAMGRARIVRQPQVFLYFDEPCPTDAKYACRPA
jgi:sn-glycerol 3-phosphate transport system ATP-binding protein